MHDIFSHATCRYPFALQQMRGFQRYFPASSHAQGYATSGSGGGFGVDSIQSAYGEFIERNHFYLNVHVDKKAFLHEVNSPAVNESLYRMIAQMKSTDQDPKNYQFNLSKVKNIFDQQDYYLPTALFTLSSFDFVDREFVPFMDSCGEAVHTSYEKAAQRSLLEFVERQALVGSWITRTFKYKIDPDVVLNNPRQKKFAEQLLRYGEMHVFDVALSVPGYAVIILYFAKSQQDYVQYAIGMAAGLSPDEAVSKALNELWLDYGYLYVSQEAWKSLSFIPASKRYTIRHVEDNNVAKTKGIMAYDLTAACNISANDFLALPTFTKQTAYEELKKITPYIFIYHHHDCRKEYEYTKILSPDLFLHMSVTDKLNVDNAYTRLLKADLNHLYRNKIPFP